MKINSNTNLFVSSIKGDKIVLNIVQPTQQSSEVKEGVSELSNIGTEEQYSEYLESLNKPNTNPILQGNQQEQVKKFVKLQERLNNKEFLEGAKNTYNSTPALQQFGTQEQYNDYIKCTKLDHNFLNTLEEWKKLYI